MPELVRQVIAYKQYFLSFYDEQPENVKAKIEWTLQLLRVMPKVPEKYFSLLEEARLAAKVGTNKFYISRIENNASDIRLSTLMKIIQKGLGGHLKLSLEL